MAINSTAPAEDNLPVEDKSPAEDKIPAEDPVGGKAAEDPAMPSEDVGAKITSQ